MDDDATRPGKGGMKRKGLAILCLLLAAGFVALGVWQVERRAWKLALIDRVEARVHAPPQPLPRRWTGDLAYTRVRVTGRFLHGSATRVQAVTALGGGWWVMTPLRTATGIVLVNRGFVSDAVRPAEPRGPVTITGLLRASEPGGAFLRSNDAAADRWYARDVPAIARARRLGPVAPFFVDADATPNPGGYPVGGLTVIGFRNDHLIYALTWFALAGLSLFGAALSWRRSRRDHAV